MLVVELVEGFGGESHELPAASSGAAGHGGGGSGGVADLQVEGVEHARFVEYDVDDEPVEEEPEVVDAEVGEPPDGAVGTVAADDEACRDYRAIHRGDRDAVRVLRESVDLDSAADVDRWQLYGALVEQRLEGRLVEHRRVGPAGWTVAFLTEAQQGGAGGVAPLVDLGRFADLTERRTDSCRLEDAGDLMVEVHGAGQRVGIGPALQHHDVVIVLGEEDGQRVADRSASDDRDVRIEAVDGLVHRSAMSVRGWRRLVKESRVERMRCILFD